MRQQSLDRPPFNVMVVLETDRVRPSRLRSSPRSTGIGPCVLAERLAGDRRRSTIYRSFPMSRRSRAAENSVEPRSWVLTTTRCAPRDPVTHLPLDGAVQGASFAAYRPLLRTCHDHDTCADAGREDQHTHNERLLSAKASETCLKRPSTGSSSEPLGGDGARPRPRLQVQPHRARRHMPPRASASVPSQVQRTASARRR